MTLSRRVGDLLLVAAAQSVNERLKTRFGRLSGVKGQRPVPVRCAPAVVDALPMQIPRLLRSPPPRKAADMRHVCEAGFERAVLAVDVDERRHLELDPQRSIGHRGTE